MSQSNKKYRWFNKFTLKFLIIYMKQNSNVNFNLLMHFSITSDSSFTVIFNEKNARV